VPTKKNSSKNKPYTANYPLLQAWLDQHEARCVWQVPLGPARNPTAYVESWHAHGHGFIVTVFADNKGWDIYTSCDSYSVPATLYDAEVRLKISEDQEHLDLLKTVRKLRNMLDTAQACMDDKNRKIFDKQIVEALQRADDVLPAERK
jgi:hypothetical protein